MPRKQLTADVARDLASLAEDGMLEALSIRPRVSGKHKGKLFAEWKEYGETTLDTPEHARTKLAEMLEDVAQRIDAGDRIEILVSKEYETQFVSYTRSEKGA